MSYDFQKLTGFEPATSLMGRSTELSYKMGFEPMTFLNVRSTELSYNFLFSKLLKRY